MIFFCHGVTVNANCGKHHKNHRQNRKGQPHAKDALRGLSERILLPCYKAKCIQNEAGHSCHHTANRLFHKGRVAEGADADLTIFVPELIIDGADYTDINILPKGISYVIQKGRVAVKDNCVVNEKLGEFISFAG